MVIALSAIMPQLQRAQLLHQQGRTGEAWAVLAPLRSAIDGDGQALRLFALVAQASGNTDPAIAALKRIAALEGDPPEIVGALADTLGQAGRHDEALLYWDALVARRPEIVDAHLNRAVTAANAGRHEDAIAAADAGLGRFPAEARLLATKAIALKNAGRVDESLAAFDKAIAADPRRALTHYNRAVTLRAAFRFDESCEAYRLAEQLGLKGAQFHAHWAAAELEAGRVDRAEELYRKALAADSMHEESRKALTRLRIEYRGGEGAFAHYEQAARERPSNPAIWFEWASALVANRRIAAALDVADRGLAETPSSGELRVVRTFAQGMLGDASAALAELDGLLPGGAGEPPFHALATQLAFRAGLPERAARMLEAQTARNPNDQIAWSMLGLAWRLLDDPREHWLCDYDRLVMITDVPSPEGKAAPDYAVEVAAVLDGLHMTMSEPGDQSLRGGTQTSGALFSRPDPAIQRFRQAVTRAAEGAVAALPDDPTHPFLRRKSPRLGFSGSWSVRLAAGGHHVSHVHSEGWMSSAYYARLPQAAQGQDSSREGWIQFGVPPDHLGLGPLEPRRVIAPSPGRLVLFPSYLWHGTIPFGSGDRLTAAFDYQPL